MDASAPGIADVVVVASATFAGSGDTNIIIILVSAGGSGIAVVNDDEIITGSRVRIGRD